ncbi:MAG: WecB/TagA/CpsF family glycosyltransferase [Patescibacteria group bacterium]|nr:WecB/TagA/CpsF family glycosyltransferase [Patescibacteria group bacterium]
MKRIDIAGLKIDAVTKKQLLDILAKRITEGQKTFLTTPYSEFLHAALANPAIMETLNQADLAVADGIGLFWAKRFLDLPLTAKSYWAKILQAFWQAKYTLAAIIFRPAYIRSTLPEKIPGSDLIWDLIELVADKNLSIYLLGGFGDTPKLAANKLQTTSYKLKIAGYSNKNPGDPTAIEDIKKASPDLLFVAYGPIKQERWIAQNLPNLPVKLAVGLGGTFDYLAHKQPQPPRFWRQAGLEWLWRLLTQPRRARRIFNATFGLANEVLLFKIYTQLPWRKNAVSVILNAQGQVLVCRRNPEPKRDDAVGEDIKKFRDYWQLPQGGIEPGEDLEAGTKREVLEETGLTNLRLIGVSKLTHSYWFPLSWKRILVKRWHFRGQIQNILFFQHQGNDSDVKIDQSEFVDYRWIATRDLVSTINPEKKNLVKLVVTELKNLEEKVII